MADYPMELLDDAITRTKRLVSGIETQKADLEANPPQITPEQLEQGRYAMDKALASARRMLENLEAAWEIAVKDIASSEASEDEAGTTDDSDDDEASDDDESDESEDQSDT